MAVDGLQVNTCRNLRCTNFGVIPLDRVDRGRNPTVVDTYSATGAGKSISAMRCKICGEIFRLKSNQAIVEELARLREQSTPIYPVGCPNANCSNFGKPESSPPSLYQSFGTTASGSPRFRCKGCHRTFSISARATLRQRQPEKNELVFSLLINKSPMRRICEVADIHPAVLYQRVAFLHQQCVRVAAQVESSLPLLQAPRIGIAVDHQDHVINWSSQFDRRVTQVSAIASADSSSGYVFGVHLDYDPRFDVHDADLAARECGDPARMPAFRRFARIFLPYESDQTTDDPLPTGTRLPARGVRVHSQYTMFAHFLYLKERLPNVAAIHFYLDRDSGIRQACFAAFGTGLKTGRIEAFLVKIDKEMMVDDKKLALAASQARLEKAAVNCPGVRKFEIAKRLIIAAITDPGYLSLPSAQRWVNHPLPNMGEPDKSISYVSDRGDLLPEVLADYLLDVRMHALDRFFMQIRRRLSVLERPIASASGQRRWHGYAVYNPLVVAQLLEIFRVAYNVTLIGKDGRTPAMRLGLAQAPLTLRAIAEFTPSQLQSSTKR